MRITYVANDGKVFDSEYDCYRYELALRMEKTYSTIRGLNAELKPTAFSSPQFMEDSEVISIETDTALKRFKEKTKEQDWEINGINSPGVYVATCAIPEIELELLTDDVWIKVDDVIAIVQQSIDSEYKQIECMEKRITNLQKLLKFFERKF